MGKKKKRDTGQKEDLALVDGFYIPQRIVDSYKLLKQACLKSVCDELEEKGYAHEVVSDNQTHYLKVRYQNETWRVELSPQHVSQLEKAIGTTKLVETLEMIKENSDG